MRSLDVIQFQYLGAGVRRQPGKFGNVTEEFEYLLLMENDIRESALSVLEQIIVLFYDRTSDQENVNDIRRWLFTKKNQGPLPPTQKSLRQHIKLARYQANCWNTALIPNTSFLAQENGDGARIQPDGNHCGLPCLKNQNPVGK